MQRRDLLLGGGVALSATIAGCSSDDTDASGGDSGNGNGSDDGGDADWDETKLLTGGAALEQTGGRLTKDREDIGWEIEDAYVDTYVENTGDGPSGTAVVDCTWYDGNGSELRTDSTDIATIAAGETWKARVYYDGTDPGSVEDFDLSVRDEAPEEPVNLDVGGMTVANVDRYVDETGVEFSVDFKNKRAEPIETVYVILKLYEDDVLVHTEMGHLEGFEAGETKRGYPFGMTGGRADAVNGREFLFADAEP